MPRVRNKIYSPSRNAHISMSAAATQVRAENPPEKAAIAPAAPVPKVQNTSTRHDGK